MKNAVQIAGIIDGREASMLVRAGVDFLGFPLRTFPHREDLSEDEAARIVARLESPAEAVLITYLGRAFEIRDLAAKLGTRRVQLHGDMSTAELRALREAAPGLFVMKSLIVSKDNLPELAEALQAQEPLVDAFITDTFDPATGARGATGKTHDWAVSRRIVEMSPRPVMLAGGLRPGNVKEAIRRVRPAGVDAHTGVEGPDGRKDEAKVRAFVGAAKEAFALLP